MSDDVLDQLGDWSQIKHEILEKYAHAYTTVIQNQSLIRKVLYIDAYAGSGYALDRQTGEQLPGSAADRVSEEAREKMDFVWGDRSWKQVVYREELNLFGDISFEKRPNAAIAEAFRQRLESVAGFTYVPEPVAMKNSNNATVYYLYFASHNKTGGRIVTDIFKKFRR